MTYNLTLKQKEILRVLVKAVRSGILDDEFIVVWTIGGADIIGFDGTPPELTKGSLEALTANNLILTSPQNYSDRVTLLERAYEAVDSNFAPTVTSLQSVQVSMNGSTIHMPHGQLNIASTNNSYDLNESSLSPEILNFFNKILESVQAISDEVERGDAEKAIYALKTEVEKGENAREITVNKWLNFLMDTAPDIGDVVIATFVNPALGFAMVFRKVAAKVKSKMNSE